MRHRLLFLLISLLVLTNILTQPASAADSFAAAGTSLLSIAPGCILALMMPGKRRNMYACLFSFGDSLLLVLPLLLAVTPDSPLISTAAVTLWMISRIAGGWMLRRSGLFCEKNFTLILAYRQTLAHCGNFPDEPHPTRNPLFDAARNAQHALLELLPVGALIAAWLLRAAGISLSDFGWTDWLVQLLVLPVLCAQLLPARRMSFKIHSVKTFVLALCGRMLLPALLMQPLLHLSGMGESMVPLLLLCAAPCMQLLADDLQRCSASTAIVEEAESIARLTLFAWPFIAAIILFLN